MVDRFRKAMPPSSAPLPPSNAARAARSWARHARGAAACAGASEMAITAGSAKSNFTLARYTSGGTLDPSFGAGGKVVADSRRSEYANALAIQPDGNLVVAGSTYVPERQDCAVARFTASGKLDPSFGAGGRAVTSLGYSCARIVLRATDASFNAISRDNSIERCIKRTPLQVSFSAV